MIRAYKPDGSLYFREGDEEDAYKVSEALMNQKYVVMLSKEDRATILSYVQTCEAYEADRNHVAFMSYDDFEDTVFCRDEEEEYGVLE